MRTRFSINEVQGLFQKNIFVGNKAKQRISKKALHCHVVGKKHKKRFIGVLLYSVFLIKDLRRIFWCKSTNSYLLQVVWWYGLLCFSFWTMVVITCVFLMKTSADAISFVFIMKCLPTIPKSLVIFLDLFSLR